MPNPIAAAAAAFAKIVAGAATIAAPSLYAVAYAAAYAGTTALIAVGLGAFVRAQVPDPETGKVTRKQPRPLRCFVAGEDSRFSGAYMHRETNANFLGVVLALCEGRLASISDIYLNDDKVTLLTGGWVQPGADGRYGINGGLVQIKTRLGLPTETYYTEMAAKFSATWPSTARGDGIASLMMICHHLKKENFAADFQNGEPIPSVVGKGVCYDWRDEAQSRADPSTWQASANPIVWLVFIEWHRHGRNWDRCIAPVLDDLTFEADYCDDEVAKVGGTEPRYRFAGNYFSNTEPEAVRSAILASMDGWLSTNGKGHMILKAGRYEEPTLTITAEHILGYNWRAFQTDEEACNELIISYTSPAHDYTEVECDPWRDEAGITAMGKERTENLQLMWVNYFTQARRLAKRKMSRLAAERRGQIRTDVFGLNALGERYIRVQNPELASMADVVLEVTNLEMDFAAGQVMIDVILADQNIDDWDPEVEESEDARLAELAEIASPTPPVITSAYAFFEADGEARVRVQGTGPDRTDLTWFFGWRLTTSSGWIDAPAGDLEDGSGVLLESGIVPAESSILVRIGYQTGGGTIVYSEGDGTVVDTSVAGADAPLPPFNVYGYPWSAGEASVSWTNPNDLRFHGARVWMASVGAGFGSATDISGLRTAAPGTGDTYIQGSLSVGNTYDFWVTAESSTADISSEVGPITITID